MTNLIDLAYIDDLEYAKMILSSGDYFPGFYRFTMGTRKHDIGQMTISGLIKAYFNQPLTYKDLMSYPCKRLEELDDRLKGRSDLAVYELLDEKYKSWMLHANEYDLVLLEKHNLKDLEVDTTYFFMGALIRFTEDSILLGYDDYRKTTIETIDVPFTFVKDYISKIYSNFSDLFIPAEVIGTIIIDDLVTIDIDVKKLLTTDNSNVVFGSNRDASKNLSMRWAKDICFSEIE
jgi:hypothetical protein